MGKQKILLIEDDIVLGTALKEFLELDAYEVLAVQNAQQGLEEFLQDHFDVVITDIRMPGKIDGIDVVRRLKAFKPKTRIIVCTGFSKDLGKIENLVHEIVKKPFSFLDIQKILENDLQKTPKNTT